MYLGQLFFVLFINDFINVFDEESNMNIHLHAILRYLYVLTKMRN